MKATYSILSTAKLLVATLIQYKLMQQKRIGRYVMVQELGEGQFGKVYRAIDSEGVHTEYAVKVMSKQKVQCAQHIWKLFLTEIEVMKKLNHPHLLKLIDFLESGSNYYVVLPFCKGGDMEKRINKQGKLPEGEAVFYLKQIMSGFLYMYQHKIMHRDFKAANILMDGNHIVIGDFGFAKAGADVTTTKLGTPFNMAPEILFSNGTAPYTSKADLWSIGVVYYQMLTGYLPFRANDMNELKQMVIQRSGKNLQFPGNVSITEDSKHLIRGLLTADQNTRMSWKDFFNHPIFTKFQEFAPAKSILSKTLRLNENSKLGISNDATRATLTPSVTTAGDGSFNAYVNGYFDQARMMVNQEKQYTENFQIPALGEAPIGSPRPSITQTPQPVPQGSYSPPQHQPTTQYPTTMQQQNYPTSALLKTAPQSQNTLRASFDTNLTPGGFPMSPRISANTTSPSLRGSFNVTPGGSMAKNPTQLAEECNNHMTHERNKYLLVLQAAKRWRDLLKYPDFSAKQGPILLVCLSLCKRGLFMIDFLSKVLQSNVDLLKVAGWNEFRNSQYHQKLLQAVLADRTACTQFMQNIEVKLNDPAIAQGVDRNTMQSVMAQANNENFLDVVNEKLMTHLLIWGRDSKGRINPTLYRELMIASVYTHYTLSLNFEFPLNKNGELFNWRQFFERTDTMDNPSIAVIVSKYLNRRDELGRSPY